MTHTQEHVVVSALNTPLMNGKKAKLWHAIVLLVVVAFIIGYAVGSP